MPSPADLKRQRILSATREVCSRTGYEAARMEEIAHVAGVSKGTLYNFFDSKEALLVATVLAAHEDFVVVLPAVDDESLGARERLEALVESLARGFEGIVQHNVLTHQAWSVVLNSPPARGRLLSTLRSIYAGYIGQLESILNAGVKCGTLSSETDIHAFATNWVAIYDGLVYRAGFEEQEPSPAYTAEGVRRSLGWLLDQLTVLDHSHPRNDNPKEHERQ